MAVVEALKEYSWVRTQEEQFKISDGFSTFRRQASEKFLGFPTLGSEEWLYTPVSAWMAKPWVVANPNDGFLLGVEKISSVLMPEHSAHRIVFINGQWAKDFSHAEGLPKGVEMVPFSKLLTEKEKTIALGERAALENQPFVALNSMFFFDGVVINIDTNVRLEKPLQVVFAHATESNLVLFCPRVFVNVGQGSEVTLIETHLGLGSLTHAASVVVEVTVGENATCHHVKLSKEETQGFHVGHTAAKLARNSRYQHFNFCLGGGLVRNDINLVLDGEGIEGNLFGLYLGNGNEHVDNHTLVDHAKPHCLSNELYKGVLSGKSKAVFNGKIIVRPNAQKTNAFQENKNILLSNQATVDTKPQLEIFADDVKCTHGATIGQLDEEAYFYLMARGIPKNQAQTMLIESFTGEVLDRFSESQSELKKWLHQMVAEKLKAIMV